MLCSRLYECVHIMDCPICCRRVLNHAHKINCCHCDKVYHMKCISIVPEEMEAIDNNSSEWICKNCLMHIFPFNSINDDSEFIQLCSNKQKHGCQISDLLYNPYDSNSEEYMGFQDFDPDTNFYIETKLIRLSNYKHLIWRCIQVLTVKCRAFRSEIFHKNATVNICNLFINNTCQLTQFITKR